MPIIMADYGGRATILEPVRPVAQGGDDEEEDGNYQLQGREAKNRFREFFRNYRRGNIYIYRDALLRHWNRKEYFIEVDIAHVNEYDNALFNCLQTQPLKYLEYFEAGTNEALADLLILSNKTDAIVHTNKTPVQIIIKSSQLPQSIRSITADHVNRLIKVPGIIISCSKVKARASKIFIRCTNPNCDNEIIKICKSALGRTEIPVKCEKENCGDKTNNRPPGTFIILGHKSEYVDQQELKLQECPEEVPTGETPRNITVTVDRYLVDKVAPGTRVSIIGISSLLDSPHNKGAGGLQKTLRTPHLRSIGIQIDTDNGGRTTSVFTPQEEEEILRYSRDPEIYEKIARSIAPQISGDYTKDIKKAIACLLMSGSRKVLPDGVRLRGDINVLLMGDPSTAKSQFLKYVEKVAPIGVYTSGKGSSAAGLTASVIKDSRGEFYLEGGAMVLADGGVICIDEFDKMRENDRVAIHEAMEQQTISIAKAGITTVLNSRASVLAAANPIFGRYDDLKGIGEQIDLMSTILSRFDLIFIVRDVREVERDRAIARHVLGVHMNASLVDQNASNPDCFDVHTLKKYVSYCRDRCAPRLNDEAAQLLKSQYVHIRNRVRESLNDKGNDQSQVIPITIRQLEALVRISEALAKMRLSAEATVSDVEEALRLFKVSTLAASQANPALMGVVGAAVSEDVKKAEEYLKRKIPLRQTVSTKKIEEEAAIQNYSNDAIRRAIAAMVLRNELQELNFRKLLKRLR